MGDRIRYKRGYKYQLHDDYTVRIRIQPDTEIDTLFLNLTGLGRLTIRAGYAWDGPSGPAIDTKTFMRGSLVHDALYELMRLGHLDRKACRAAADQVMQDICREDGMCRLRAWWVLRGVRWFGGRSTRRERKICEAP